MIGSTHARMTAEVNRQSKLSAEISRAQAQVSSGLRIGKPSDDPTGSARVSQIRRDQADLAQWTRNLEVGAGVAGRVDTVLEGVSTQVDRARELIIQGRSGTYSAADRAIMAAELRGIAEDIASQARTTDANGRPLFPADEPLKLPIGSGLALPATVSRDAAFGDLEVQIAAAADALEIEDGVTRQAATGTALDRLAQAGDTLTAVRSEQGLRAARFDAALERHAAATIDAKVERGAIEGTDLAETVAYIQQTLLTLQASQTTFARISAQTLFDILG
ncbi:flagellin-like protein [Sphingomonas sp. 1P06PA]|uniref:flagellin n=1 Tax=Sphingomonas sp. 1P06PA TaxID=554121 RepID=UPI0039A6F297